MKIANQPLTALPVKSNKNGKTEEKFQIDKANATMEMSKAEEMTNFKKEFYNELSTITSHQTVSNMAVNVSEKAFQAMKDDPEYREKVLSLIKRDCGSSYAPRNCSLLITVGASIEEYRGDSWPVDYDSEFRMRSQNSFYKKTNEKADEQAELLEEYIEKKMLARKLQQKLNNQKNMSQASMAYEANVLNNLTLKGNL